MNEMKKQKEKVIPNKIYARVVGYYRVVDGWNDGKQQEWKARNIIQGVGKTKACCT